MLNVQLWRNISRRRRLKAATEVVDLTSSGYLSSNEKGNKHQHLTRLCNPQLYPQRGGCITAAPLKSDALLLRWRIWSQWSAALTPHIQLGTHLNVKSQVSRIVFEIPCPAQYLRRSLFCDGNGEPCVGEFATNSLCKSCPRGNCHWSHRAFFSSECLIADEGQALQYLGTPTEHISKLFSICLCLSGRTPKQRKGGG